MRGVDYGWGRNKYFQLGSLPSSSSSSEGVKGESMNNNTMIPLPCTLTVPFVVDSIPIVVAATGKGRNVFIDTGGAAYACRSNKMG